MVYPRFSTVAKVCIRQTYVLRFSQTWCLIELEIYFTYIVHTVQGKPSLHILFKWVSERFGIKKFTSPRHIYATLSRILTILWVKNWGQYFKKMQPIWNYLPNWRKKNPASWKICHRKDGDKHLHSNARLVPHLKVHRGTQLELFWPPFVSKLQACRVIVRRPLP